MVARSAGRPPWSTEAADDASWRSQSGTRHGSVEIALGRQSLKSQLFFDGGLQATEHSQQGGKVLPLEDASRVAVAWLGQLERECDWNRTAPVAGIPDEQPDAVDLNGVDEGVLSHGDSFAVAAPRTRSRRLVAS